MALDVGIAERIGDGEEQQRRTIENTLANARMAIPGQIIGFNASNQTATVQPAIKERVKGEWVQLPQLLDVPCFFPRAGGHCLTFPVKPGDECLVIFNDMCIDGWWQSGGVQTQIEVRRHDLSDAMALLGVTSVPRAVTEYSTDSVMLRNEDKDAYFEIKDNKEIYVKSVENINVETEKSVIITAAENVDIQAADNVKVIAAADIEVMAKRNITLQAAMNVNINASCGVNIVSTEGINIKTSADVMLEPEGGVKIKSNDAIWLESKKTITLKAKKIEEIEG